HVLVGGPSHDVGPGLPQGVEYPGRSVVGEAGKDPFEVAVVRCDESVQRDGHFQYDSSHVQSSRMTGDRYGKNSSAEECVNAGAAARPHVVGVEVETVNRGRRAEVRKAP